ncbi:MAG: GntR family transcriptional regulator [Firmicutes bacterium]|nr:GntR family transcriptional regulator [Bacillota bacterium]
MKRSSLTEGDYESPSLRTRIFESIRENIVNGAYRSGESLIESKLAEEFGVSRTPVREAIRQLELEGLVRSVPNRGVVVEGITTQEVYEIYAIRGLIEGLAARWAAERATPEEIGRMDEAIALMEFYTLRSNVDQVTRLDTGFHTLMIEASKSRPLKNALGGLNHYIQRARVASLRVPGRLGQSLEEHRAIFQAIKDRQPELAERLLNEHIGKASENLLNHLKTGEEGLNAGPGKSAGPADGGGDRQGDS